jgi:hypothetical protein
MRIRFLETGPHPVSIRIIKRPVGQALGSRNSVRRPARRMRDRGPRICPLNEISEYRIALSSPAYILSGSDD